MGNALRYFTLFAKDRGKGMIHKITINNVVYLYKDIDEVIKAIQKAKEEKEHAGKENIHLHH